MAILGGTTPVLPFPDTAQAATARSGAQVSRLGVTNGVTRRRPGEFDGEEPVAGEGGAEFEGKVLEERAFVDGNDDLSPVLLRQRPQQSGELRDMDLVHALNGVVDHQPRKRRNDR